MAIILINPNSTEAMTEAMVATARRAAPEHAFEGWTSRLGPPAIQGAADGEAATPPLLDLVRRASAQGAEGIIIGCFDDTALREAAAIAACPVVGLGQASYHYAALRNWRFSVVTTLAASVPVLEENIRDLGLGQHLGRVRASEVPVLELERDPASAQGRILSEAECAAEEDRVSALILGCGGMVAVTEAVRRAVPKEIIDPVACAARSFSWLLGI